MLGFSRLEKDPDHGGVFLSLPGTSHTIDLFPAGAMGSSIEPSANDASLVHIAFRVGSYAQLREAHATLEAHGIPIQATIDHVNQRSIYFRDPEGNGLELYYERSDWAEIFARGRGDRDARFSFDDPAPQWE
ncbi:MAG: VOC family protein [Gammaproteobacteria bacterium]